MGLYSPLLLFNLLLYFVCYVITVTVLIRGPVNAKGFCSRASHSVAKCIMQSTSFMMSHGTGGFIKNILEL